MSTNKTVNCLRSRENTPNILFLMTDEQRFDLAGFSGNEIVRTPTLDRIAGNGVIFDNAYTPSPICIPGRQSMMAGQFPRTTGCLQFGDDLPAEHDTFARRFSRHGWETVACGKLHHLGTDQLQGWTRRIAGDVMLGSQFISEPHDDFNRNAERSESYKWDDAKEIRRAGPGRGPVIATDERTVEGTVDFIEQYFSDPYYDRATPRRPLFLKVSLLQPHYPYLADKDRFTYYLNRVKPYFSESTFEHPFLQTRQVKIHEDVSAREAQRATASYYAMVERADAMFGEVIDALEHQGEDLSDWIVVFTSDHGEMLGQHGVWEKQKFFEGSVRVPLILSWPARFGAGRVASNVTLCDLYSTLCDLAGLETPPGLDSRSLVPFMLDPTSQWPGDYDNEAISHFGDCNLMIKRDQLKYQYYGESMPEVLFDLATDPGETLNVIHDQDHNDAVVWFQRRRNSLGYGPNSDAFYANAGYSN